MYQFNACRQSAATKQSRRMLHSAQKCMQDVLGYADDSQPPSSKQCCAIQTVCGIFVSNLSCHVTPSAAQAKSIRSS